MDPFNASDTFFHTTVIQDQKVCTEMNDCLRTHRVPAPHNGVYCNLKETLREGIEELVCAMQFLPSKNIYVSTLIEVVLHLEMSDRGCCQSETKWY